MKNIPTFSAQQRIRESINEQNIFEDEDHFPIFISITSKLLTAKILHYAFFHSLNGIVHIDQWIDILRSLIEPSWPKFNEIIDYNNTAMETYYVVVEK